MMRREDRAKQFMPFDAMKGLKEALRDREERHTRTEKRDLSEESKATLNDLLQRLEQGTTITLRCHHNHHETTLTGKVTEINYPAKYVILEDTEIYFDNIYEIRIQD